MPREVSIKKRIYALAAASKRYNKKYILYMARYRSYFSTIKDKTNVFPCNVPLIEYRQIIPNMYTYILYTLFRLDIILSRMSVLNIIKFS